MSWAKGQRSNPCARPDVAGEIRELARQRTLTAFRMLVEIAERSDNESARIAARTRSLIVAGASNAPRPAVGPTARRSFESAGVAAERMSVRLERPGAETPSRHATAEVGPRKIQQAWTGRWTAREKPGRPLVGCL